MRAAVLRLLGYRVDVIDFVDSKHTPRNTLLRAVRTGAPRSAEQAAELDDADPHLGRATRSWRSCCVTGWPSARESAARWR